MIAEPLSSGAAHETRAELTPAVAVTLVGFAGTATGIAGNDDGDGWLVPTPLVAVAVKVYDVPLVSP